MLRGDLNWTEIHGRGDTFIHTAVSPCCTAATDITMYSNNTPIKKKKRSKSGGERPVWKLLQVSREEVMV